MKKLQTDQHDPKAPLCQCADAAMANRLEPVLNVLHRMDAEITRAINLLTDIHRWLVESRPQKQWYSPAEVADILGRSHYTVREWCRMQRINARKRRTGRGGAKEWEISSEEVERIKNHGLLPIPARY